jgi:hypothetical protein
MTTGTNIDWNDAESAARHLAGNWRRFDSFAWHRGYAGLLAQSNQKVINERLAPFSEGEDPDVVFERHSHFLVGHVDGVSVRVYRPDCTITTDAFKEFCRIKERLDDYPILDEQDYGEREYGATLDNYRSEMWRLKDRLPAGWESEVYSWFSDHGQDRFIENRDDQGGWAPREAIIEALQDLGLLPTAVVKN